MSAPALRRQRAERDTAERDSAERDRLAGEAAARAAEEALCRRPDAAVERALRETEQFAAAVAATVPRRPTIPKIIRAVSRLYLVTVTDLLGSRRTADVVRPRQVGMYLARTLTPRSLPEIGRRFGGRDHTTVLHAVRKIDGLLHTDNALAEDVDLLKRMLSE